MQLLLFFSEFFFFVLVEGSAYNNKFYTKSKHNEHAYSFLQTHYEHVLFYPSDDGFDFSLSCLWLASWVSRIMFYK